MATRSSDTLTAFNKDLTPRRDFLSFIPVCSSTIAFPLLYVEIDLVFQSSFAIKPCNMKKLLNNKQTALVVLAAILLGFGCKKSNDSISTGGSSDTGSFSVMLGGKTISGTDKNNNGVVIIPADPSASFTPDGDIFCDFQNSGDSIGFHLPDRTGTTVIGGYNTPAHIYGVFTIPSDVYVFDSVTVNVTTLTSSRIKGTFSGHLSTSLLAGQGDQADISSGTFDLPLLP